MSRTQSQILTAIISVVDKMIDVLFILVGLLLWVIAGFLIYDVYMLATMAREMAGLDPIIYLILTLVLTVTVPHTLIVGYIISRDCTKGSRGKVEGRVKTNNAYLVYSTALDKDSFEPMVDIVLASDRIKAEDVFLAEYPNAVEALIRSELVDADIERAEGALKFDLEDELYWELWDLVGDERILKVIKDAEANSGC